MTLLRYFIFAVTTALTAKASTISYSPVVGGMTLSVPAGQTRSFALPLLHETLGAGKMHGRITGVGSNYIEVSDAAWTPGALSNSANPYYLRIKSGTARGRSLLVTTAANTASRVYLNNDGIDLSSQGLVLGESGDQFELVLADTLGSFFGDNTLQGGTDAASADNVLVWGGAAWLTFYYNTDRNRWERNVDTAASPTRNNYLLRPDRGLMIVRRGATQLDIRITGRVPTISSRFFHSRPGVTFLSNGLPVGTTLGQLALQTRTVGWQGHDSGTTATAQADLIQVWGGASWLIFYYNTVNNRWQRNLDTDASPSRDTFSIPAGRPIMIRRLNGGSTPADGLIEMPMPYTTSS